jgi:CDP-glucose 4,6-dehydratase
MSATLLQKCFAGKRVWLSGHTGFKGSWLSQWLLNLGAEVHGFSLAAPTQPSLFEQLGLADRVHQRIADVRDAAAVKQSIRETKPDFVFHLAAQSIVRTSFEQPLDTYATNVLGTLHVMEALRELQHTCGAVLVTTDKCYENREWEHGYREEDVLGGYDPYSSSKAAAEIGIASWRRSFFSGHAVRLASARAGNVIGGGDWARDRIMPDCVRALQRGQPIGVRNKISTRPWQFVLEPLSGYLWLAAILAKPSLRPYDQQVFTGAFNFGPSLDSNRTVAELVSATLKHWPGAWEDKSNPNAVHEATSLNLSTDKAFHFLGWRPVWGFEKTVEATVTWYRQANEMGDAPGAAARLADYTSGQIACYENDAVAAGLPWAAA